MRRITYRGCAIALLGLSCGLMLLWNHPRVVRAEQAATKDHSAKSTSQPGKADLAHIESKLDELLANQHTILQKLDEMKDELQIIKVRATLKR